MVTKLIDRSCKEEGVLVDFFQFDTNLDTPTGDFDWMDAPIRLFPIWGAFS